MSGARAAGSYLYSEGYRLCVMCSGGKALRKTSLQSAFGDFGHIVQIETPKSNLAFVAFDDGSDAKEAMRYMDGKNVDGQVVSVTKAGPKPNYKTERGELPVLMTTQTEREEVSRRASASWEEKQGSEKGRGGGGVGVSRGGKSPARRSPTKRRSRSRSRGQSRTRSRSHRRSPSRSHSQSCGRSQSRSRRNGSSKRRHRSRSRSRKVVRRGSGPRSGGSCSRGPLQAVAVGSDRGKRSRSNTS